MEVNSIPYLIFVGATKLKTCDLLDIYIKLDCGRPGTLVGGEIQRIAL